MPSGCLDGYGRSAREPGFGRKLTIGGFSVCVQLRTATRHRPATATRGGGWEVTTGRVAVAGRWLGGAGWRCPERPARHPEGRADGLTRPVLVDSPRVRRGEVRRLDAGSHGDDDGHAGGEDSRDAHDGAERRDEGGVTVDQVADGTEDQDDDERGEEEDDGQEVGHGGGPSGRGGRRQDRRSDQAAAAGGDSPDQEQLWFGD